MLKHTFAGTVIKKNVIMKASPRVYTRRWNLITQTTVICNSSVWLIWARSGGGNDAVNLYTGKE